MWVKHQGCYRKLNQASFGDLREVGGRSEERRVGKECRL